MLSTSQIPLPKQLGLNPQFRPQGYYTNFKQWPIYPNSSNQYWGPQDVVRFYNTIDTGVMDPYRSSIEFTVQTTPQTQPVGQLQVDKLATSFFGQMVISSKNIQIQRIAQYDTLCAMLSDIGTSQVITQGRSFQGMGYTNYPSCAQLQPSSSYSSQLMCNYGQNWAIQSVNQNGINPTRVGSWSGIGDSTQITADSAFQSPFTVSGSTGSNVSLANYLCYGLGNTNTMSGISSTYGRFNNIRAQYNMAISANNYPDTNYSYLQTSPYILNQTWTPTTMMGNSTTSGYNSNNPYQIQFANNFTVNKFIQGQQTPSSITYPTTPNLHGYTKPISAQTCKSGGQATISSTVPSCQMVQGQIINAKYPIAQKRFTVPLFSSTVGCLIPPDQFLLIQMKALKDLLIQLTLSPYAMFTSGYCDVHQFDNVGMQAQQKRNWMISNIQWNIHLYTFSQTIIQARLTASLVKGIAITSSFYSMGNTFQLPNGQVVRNMWPISCQAQSLSQIYCVFLSNQYQKYSFCRKQFRLSNNITSMQVRLKTQFFPSQPLTGNAGNPQIYQGNADNSVFLKQLFWSNNYIFNLNIPMPKINKINFAINGRCYNTSNQNTYYDPKSYQDPAYVWTTNSVNMDTAMGMPSFHQNRYIGMAIYSWTWQPYGHSSQYMNGVNTNGNQNFGIQFTTSPTNPFPSDQTLIIFCRSNGIVIYTQQGVQVIGK